MRLASVAGTRLAVVADDRLVDVTDALGLAVDRRGPLQALLERDDPAAELRALDLAALPSRPLDGAALDAPLPRPGKVVGAPVNYRDHQAEMREQHTVADLGVFLKAGTSVVGPGGPVRLPYRDVRTDQEGELGVVIGRTAPVQVAMDVVISSAKRPKVRSEQRKVRRSTIRASSSALRSSGCAPSGSLSASRTIRAMPIAPIAPGLGGTITSRPVTTDNVRASESLDAGLPWKKIRSRN